MANTVSVSGSVGIFAHCAVPLNLLSDFELDSHFETNEGLAVRGNISAKEVTLFRINSALSHIFITKALVKRIPKMKSACRTQVELVLSNNAVNYFRNNPFGNHHLILPGDYTQRLLLAAKTLKMNVVEAL